MPNYSKSYKAVVTSAKLGYDNISWTGMRDAYNQASDSVEHTVRAEHESIYQKRLDELNAIYTSNNGESGAYEGNFSDSENMPQIDEDLLLQAKDKAGQAAVKGYVETFGLIDYSHIFMPQIITILARMTLKRNDNGFISGAKFRRDNFNTDTLKGLYRFLMLDARSSYLKTQYKAPNSSYCALVPTIMYAHKLVHGVKYSEWDKAEIDLIVHPQLAQAMLYTPGPMTDDEIMHQRTEGLTVRSGAAEGKVQSAVWKHRLVGPQLKEGIFKDTPYLAQVMLAQIWCAHPENRSAYMVLDPIEWDKVPAPLISKDVFKPKAAVYTSAATVSENW